MTASSRSTMIVLYDGQAGGTPDTQGRMIFRTSPDAAVTQTWAAGVTLLDTTAHQRDAAGYFVQPNGAIMLDRNVGYDLDFAMQLLDENHSTSDKNNDGAGDRAGFSVLVLSNDLKGIELGFWFDLIWAQDDGVAEPPVGSLFTQAERAAFNTTRELVNYTLTIRGDMYTLSVAGVPILRGRLRDYSAFEGPVNPYRTPNFLFLGDDTSSAQAIIKLACVSLTIHRPGAAQAH